MGHSSLGQRSAHTVCQSVHTPWTREPRASRMQGLGCMDYALNSAPHFSGEGRWTWRELSEMHSLAVREGPGIRTAGEGQRWKARRYTSPVFPDHPIFSPM